MRAARHLWPVLLALAGCLPPSSYGVGETAGVLDRGKVAGAAGAGPLVSRDKTGNVGWAGGLQAGVRVGVGARQEVGATAGYAYAGGNVFAASFRYKVSPVPRFAVLSELGVGTIFDKMFTGASTGVALIGSMAEHHRARLYGGFRLSAAGGFHADAATEYLGAPLGVMVRLHKYADLFVEAAAGVVFNQFVSRGAWTGSVAGGGQLALGVSFGQLADQH